ncbi:MAG: DUF4430 domain-containing protein [Ruminococcus sp.]|nr:DUF4430 domain-containing protein [Ruminococcus sp.]
MKANKNKFLNLFVILLFLAIFIFIIVFAIRPSNSGDFSSTNVDNTIYVTLTIDYSAVLEEDNYSKLSDNLKDDEILSDSGTFLNDIEIELSDESTVLDALILACNENNLSLDYEPASKVLQNTAYINGIGGLYEGDCTKSSGWVYCVNGIEPDVGTDDYLLSDNDEILFEFIVY